MKKEDMRNEDMRNEDMRNEDMRKEDMRKDKESKNLKPDQQNSARTLPHPLDQAEAEESDEVEIVSNPYKKVKPNEDNPEAGRDMEYDYVGSGVAVQSVCWKSSSGSVKLP